jgi:4-hydroxy-2-oxoglutarate aldolase
MQLSGVLLPLTTPYRGERIAPELLVENIARYEEAGVDGYLILGTTAEAVLLEDEEKLALLRAARSVIPPAKPLLAGVGLESTAATIRLAHAAADCGASLLLVLTPHYFKTHLGNAAQIAFFTAVADAARRPVLLYDMPFCTGMVLSSEAIAKLSAHPNIAGLKDSGGDLAHLREVLARVPRSFQVLCGNAAIFQPALEAGAAGGILAAADVYPEPMLAIARAMREGRTDDARRMHERMRPAAKLAVSDFGIAGVKAAMDLRGLHGGDVRRPLLPIEDVARRALRDETEALVREKLLPGLRLRRAP